MLRIPPRQCRPFGARAFPGKDFTSWGGHTPFINLIIMKLELADLTEQVIGACIAVHKEKGPGFLESIYENCLRIELRHRGIKAEFQKPVDIYYRDELVGSHKLDVFVNDELVVELKAIKELEDIHFAQVRSYLRATGKKHGLLINFASLTLTVKRVI
jgi:GxxExxY protein